MTLTMIYVGSDKKVRYQDDTYKWEDLLTNKRHQELITQAMACNTSGNEEHASATEKAMLKFLKKLNIDFEEIRKVHIPDPYVRFQFTSKRKRMSTVI